MSFAMNVAGAKRMWRLLKHVTVGVQLVTEGVQHVAIVVRRSIDGGKRAALRKAQVAPGAGAAQGANQCASPFCLVLAGAVLSS